MHKLLIPLLVCLTASLLHAQVPKIISISPNSISKPLNPDAPDAACFAGTFTVGQFIGQSNDIDLDTIYLCFGDSIFIDHNGDQMFMDPNPATPPGISYAYYHCLPTATGDEMVVVADPCIWQGAANGFFAVNGPPSGDTWFFNTGSLINSSFCNGVPCAITFAPITITDFNGGALEPGCVDVNTNAAFTVVYLKEIVESGISTNFGDDCKGKFRLRGGYPEWDGNATYTVTITLASDPNVKALIYTPPAQMKHGNDIIFSVPQSGVYNVTVEDGKSCGAMFQINMNTCTPSNNVTISLPEVISPPGSQICIPITVQNFTDILGASFSLTWDPTVLQYVSIQNANPAIQPFTASGNLNEQNSGQGYLGIIYFDNSPTSPGVDIPNGQTLVEVCFNVLAPIGTCTPLDVQSFPTLITMDNAQGQQLAITVDTGQVCSDLVPLDVQFYVDTPTCSGTASIGVIINGGTAPYDITWKMLPAGATSLVTSLVADTILTAALPEGTYSVCVTDGNGVGNTICDTLTIDVPSLGGALTVVQSPLCNGGMDGAVKVDVSIDGVVLPTPLGPNISFAWNSGLPPNQTQNNLKAGNYSVTITDSTTGCTAVAAGSLSQPSAMMLNAQVVQASCPGVADGMITSTVTGGTPLPGNMYSFSWEYSPNISGMPLFTDDAGSLNPFVMSNKPAGYYFVTVTDANGCTYVHPTEVEIPNLREVTVDLVDLLDPTCAGLANGSIKVEVNAQPAFANPDYLFFWNAPGFPQVNNANMSTYSSLPPGTYDVLALETNTGCSDTATFIVTEPQPLVASVLSTTSPSCKSQNDGSISVVATGGSGGPNYTYTWSANPVQGLPLGPNQQNLVPGTYTVVVTDINGCSDSLVIVLNLPAPPAITAVDSTSVKCGSDGCLSVTAPTGVTFLWETLSGNMVGNTAQVCGLPGDTYVVTVQDAQMCVNKDTFTLAPVVPLFVADSLLTLPQCFGNSDGSIALDVQGGNPGYTYMWSGGQNTPVIFAIKAGTYTVTVTDLKGCTLVKTYKLPNPPNIAVSSNSIQAATCPGVCDGQATIVPIYSNQMPADFNFLWADGSTDSMRVDLCPGVDSVTITDAFTGCAVISFVNIGSPPDIVGNIDTVPVTCFGGDDGEAIATVSGGNGAPFTFNWSSGAGIPQATGLAAGPYTLTVTDRNGCTAMFVTDVTQPDEIVVTQNLIASSNILCFGDSTGIIAVDATGGNPGGYTYKWSDGTTNIGTTNPIDNLSSGAYAVTVTDPKGCSGTLLNIILSDPPAVQGLYQPWEPLLCNGDETTLYIDSIFGGSGAPYQFSLDFGVYLDKDFPVTLSGGEHYITYIDRLGCEYTDTILVVEPDPIVVTFDPNVVEIELGDSLQLLPLVTGAVVDTFVWTPADETLHFPNQLEPYAYPFQSETYTLVVQDENGCTATGSITVNIDPNRNVYIPNAILAGNPKGLNDHFNPIVGRGVEMVNYMRIFDRWGNLMYERDSFFPNNNDFAEGWDGRYKGQYVQPGVYVYVIEVKFLDRRVLVYRGDITVLR